MRRALVSLAAVLTASAALACPPAERITPVALTDQVVINDCCRAVLASLAKVEGLPAGCFEKAIKATTVAKIDAAPVCGSKRVRQVAAGRFSACCASGRASTVAKIDAAPSCRAKRAQARVASLATPARSRCSEAAWKAAGVPALLAVIGDQKTSCPVEARKIAKESGAEAVYFVQGEKYYCGNSATKAWTKELVAYLGDATTVKYAVAGERTSCRATAAKIAKAADAPVKYEVASFTFSDRETADRVALAAKRAVCGVSLTYTVGDQEMCCKYKARAIADETGLPIVYAIGDRTTDSETQAAMMETMARIQAVLGTVEAASEG